jgi:bifunctional non-homologous end joining protein LigD
MVPDGDAVHVAGVRVTHPERVLFEDLGLTKEALARYYESVAEWMLPELRERPLSLVRCLQGPGEGCFYQKNIDAKFSAEIERVPVELGGGGVYAAASSIGAVVSLVQMGVIELHVWGATTRDLARPDRMVLDLDQGDEPGAPADLRHREVHRGLEDAAHVHLVPAVPAVAREGLQVAHDLPDAGPALARVLEREIICYQR